MAVALRFKPLADESLPAKGDEVLLFLHDKWRGHDEIITATFDGSEFLFKGRNVPVQFIQGWREYPVVVPYDCNRDILL